MDRQRRRQRADAGRRRRPFLPGRADAERRDRIARPLVVAQEAEFADRRRRCACVCDRSRRGPSCTSAAISTGYGWCFRKGDYLNVGFGRLDARASAEGDRGVRGVPQGATQDPAGRVVALARARLPVAAPTGRRIVDDGVMLIGDAAGLAYPQSGEGIRPAIESGLLAASAILSAAGRYTRDQLDPYERRLRTRFGVSGLSRLLSRIVPDTLAAGLAPRLLEAPWFVRRVLLHRWFLHAHQPGIAPAPA